MKTKKRLYIILLLLFGFSFQAKAQLVTYDPTSHATSIAQHFTRVANFVKNSQILTSAISTLNSIRDTKEMFEEIDDELKFVKNMIQTGKEITEIIQLIDNVSNEYQDSINFIVNDPFVDFDTKEFIIEVYYKELDKSISAFDTGDLLVSDDSYKMTDGERLNLLRSIKDEIQGHLNFIRYFDSKIKYSMRKSKSEYATYEILSGGQNFFNIED